MGYVVGDVKKVDERDIVFARNKLKPGSKEYDAYYEAHPELEEMDKTIRDTGVPVSVPGWVIPGARTMRGTRVLSCQREFL